MKGIEHQGLHRKPKSGKTMGRGAIKPLYQIWYEKKRREEEEERVTMFSDSLNLTFTMKPRKYNIFIYVCKNPSPLSISRREKAQSRMLVAISVCLP